MKALEHLRKKRTKLVVGLMSGTSADGIDAVVVEIRGNGERTRLRQRAFQTFAFPAGFKAFLLKNSDARTARLDDVARLNVLLGMLFADAARRIVRRAGVRLTDIDLIGSHGQTIQHLPGKRRLFGKDVGATLQIGSPSVIAKHTGVVTVGDFRLGDIAVGGNGAPLVPYFDYVMFRSANLTRALLNIGGIANLTVLPRRCTVNDVRAFDTGPGNMIIDGLMRKWFRRPYDTSGALASRGQLIPELLRWLMSHPYLKEKPPKSTGREVFGEALIRKIVQRSKRQRKQDVVATVSEFTALSVYEGYLRFVGPAAKLDGLLASGGGARNTYIMERLRRYFYPVPVMPVKEPGFTSDSKEAVCFAVLANETVAENPANVPRATGARSASVLGTVCLP